MGIVGIPLQIYALSTYLRVLGVGRTGVNTMAGFVIQAVLMIAFAWYLWRQDVCELFLQSPRSGSASR